MRFIDYLKDKMSFLIFNLFIFGVLTMFLSLASIGSGIIFVIFIIWFFPLTAYIILQYFKEKDFLNDLVEVTEKLDRKYLLPEILEEPDFIEGKIFYDSIRESNKSMHEQVNTYKNKQRDYREYIEMWVHEIKTPIASTKLVIDNNKNKETNIIGKELKKIESLVEQVLYYSKSDEANKDYIIKKIPLKKAVISVIKKNSRDFIEKKIVLEVDDIKEEVFSDVKWVEFILNQIIINSLKYTKQGGKIKIYSRGEKNKIILTIEDNGVGIVKEDISKVFIKGFTGENGRVFGKSTGIGLYLCKKLCNKLGLGLTLTSEINKGCRVNIIFPKGNYTNF